MSRDVRDRALPYPGSSDRWERGPAGQIITTEFFGAALQPVAGELAVWSSSTWLRRPVKVWLGSSWLQKPAKRWSGSGWLLS